MDTTAGSICGSFVGSHQHRRGCEFGKKTAVQQERQSYCCLPPTLAALIEHKKAAYQAGHCWGQMMTPAPKLPSPNDWGWKKKASGGWDVIWTTPLEATEACRELLRCGSKIDCKRGRWKVIRCL